MVFTEAVVTALAVLAVQLGFKKIQEERNADGTISLTGIAPNGDKVTLVQLRNPTLGSPQYDLINLTTSAVKKDPAAPIYSISNDSSIDKRIFTIAFIPVDAVTKSEAVLEIFLNEKRLFPITNGAQGMLSGVTSLNVPIPANYGLAINESKKLEVFLWNPSGNPINVTFAVFIANMR